MTETGPSTEQAEVADADDASDLGLVPHPNEQPPAHEPTPEPTAEPVKEPAVEELAPDPEPEPGLPEVGLHIGQLTAAANWEQHVDALKDWRQGHLLTNVPTTWLAPAGTDPINGQELDSDTPAPLFLPDGTPAIICTQTCDLGAEPPGTHHPFVQVAPLVHGSLLDDSVRKLAGKWQVGYLVPVNPPFPPPAPEPANVEESLRRRKEPLHEWFADLRLIAPISKALLLDQDPVEGFPTEELYGVFAETLGYKFRRPALHEALSETIPGALETFIKKRGAKKSYCQDVEHLRVLVLEGTALEPTRAVFFVITDGIELTPDDKEVWEQFQAIAADLLRDGGIKVSPMRFTSTGRMSADLYRKSVPVPSDILNAPGFP